MRRLRRAQQRQAKKHKRFRRRAIAAGTAAAIALGAGTSLNKALAGDMPDKHRQTICGSRFVLYGAHVLETTD